MSDTRQALEEAFKAIYPEPSREWETWDGARIAEQREEDKASFMRWNDWRICKEARFRRFLDAEAWTDAAMCLVPESHRIVTLTEHVDRGGWYVKLAVHSPHKALPAVEAPTLALALAQACLKARENGDG
ncbi:hypothetical protein [Novosphingobium sp. ES2-1]|uniref:hypothetical protein n=1 Tax=Novosphingobium sp. ES2-1 TaxID=2780074 RepID=UPI00187F3855|nr:hypothetical protein [Novosphingobium sp. ES2-1]QOV92584.1 hypothetical protein IM701_07670 [Novosphingobium sp. ES2-1]